MEQPCGANTEAISTLKTETAAQWSAITTLRNKLDEIMRKWIPLWVTVVLMIMSGVTGSALTFAGMIIKFSNGR